MPTLLATEKGRSFLHMKISKEQSISVRLQFFGRGTFLRQGFADEFSKLLICTRHGLAATDICYSNEAGEFTLSEYLMRELGRLPVVLHFKLFMQVTELIGK